MISSAIPVKEETTTQADLGTSTNKSVQGLGKLALAIINLLHELLERQAIRRMENGSLTNEEIERVGSSLLEQSLAIEKLCEQFGVDKNDLNIDLGPLGKLL